METSDQRPLPMVLMYHSVEPYETDPYQVTVRPERFDRQLRWLRSRGLRGVSMTELLDAHADGRADSLVGLTFDDGYADFARHVMPVLDRYSFTATVFVVAGVLGGENGWDAPGPRKRLMTADQVRAAAAEGMEIGSHSLTHARLTDVPTRVLADEVNRSRVVLGDVLGDDITGFCYPYGAVGTREIAAVRAAGYSYACAVYRSPINGRHAIARTFVGDRDNTPRLYAKWARFSLLHRRKVGV